MKLPSQVLFLATLFGVVVSATSCKDAPPAPPVRDFISSKVGTFNLSLLDPSGVAYTPLLYRLREETFHNRTSQLRHGSYLRQFEAGDPLNITAAANEDCAMTLNEFMHKYGLTGFMVIQDGRVRQEEYKLGNVPGSRHDVQSVTKSVLTTTLAIAQADGKLSVNDPVSRHVPEMVGTAWQDVSLLALANMVSGVEQPSDSPDMDADLYPQTDPNAVLNWLKTFKKVAEPWEKFHYQSPNFYLLSTCIARAINEPLEKYITRKIWIPAGMKYDGYLRTTGAGQVDGHGGMSITLTDMGRLGSFILDGLKGRGGPSVPKGWFEAISEANNSTGVRAPGATVEVPTFGYQTGWWTPRRGGSSYQLGDDKTFTAFGMYGQVLYIIPRLNTVIAIQSGYPIHDPNLSVENEKFVTTIVKALKEEAGGLAHDRQGSKPAYGASASPRHVAVDIMRFSSDMLPHEVNSCPNEGGEAL